GRERRSPGRLLPPAGRLSRSCLRRRPPDAPPSGRAGGRGSAALLVYGPAGRRSRLRGRAAPLDLGHLACRARESPLPAAGTPGARGGPVADRARAQPLSRRAAVASCGAPHAALGVGPPAAGIGQRLRRAGGERSYPAGEAACPGLDPAPVALSPALPEGSVNQKRLPRPTSLVTPIRPPCASTARRQKVRPRPEDGCRPASRDPT